MNGKSIVEALLSKLQKSDKDYSDIPEDIIQALAKHEGTSGGYTHGIMNDDNWDINRAKILKQIEEGKNGVTYSGKPILKDYGDNLMPLNALQNYNQSADGSKGKGMGDIDRLHNFLRLQDILRK